MKLMRANCAGFILGLMVMTALTAAAQEPVIVIHEIPPALNLISEIPPSQAGQPAPQPEQQSQGQADHPKARTNPLPQVETFTGAIRKTQDGCVLQAADGLSYRLDDVRKAMPFDGKRVQITGQLELDTNLIHIETIKPAE